MNTGKRAKEVVVKKTGQVIPVKPKPVFRPKKRGNKYG